LSRTRAVDIAFRAALEDFNKEVAKIPGITKKEARAMTAQWRGEYQETQKVAYRAAREQARAAQQASRAWRDDMTSAFDQIIPGFGVVSDAAERASMAIGGMSAGTVALGAGALAAVAALGAMTAATAKAAEYAAELAQDAYDSRVAINDLSQTTGLATDTLSALQLATGANDDAFTKISQKVVEFSKNLGEASRGKGEARDALAALGVEVTDSEKRLRGLDELFVETIDDLQGMESGAVRTTLATKLLGREGAELMATLGDTRLSKFVELADVLGVDVGPEATRSMAKWRAANDALAVASQKLGDELLNVISEGSELDDVVDQVAKGVVALAVIVGETGPVVTDNLGEVVASMATVATGAAQLASGNVSGAVLTFGAAMQQAGSLAAEFDGTRLGLEVAQAVKALDELRAAREAANIASAGGAAGGGPAQAGGAASPVAAVAAEIMGPSSRTDDGAAFRAAAEAAAEQQRAVMDLEQTLTRLRMGELDGAAAVNAKYDEQIDKVRELARATGEYAAAREAQQILEGQRQRELGEIADAEAEADAKRKRQAFDSARAVAQAGVDFGNSIADLILETSGASVTAQEDMTEQQKRAMRSAFAVQKATALAQAGINTALAVTQALGQLPPPASFVVAGLSGAMGAVQIGLIAAKQPPSFHQGGLITMGGTQPDEVPITARAGEGVLSTQAMSRIGREGLDAMNRGEMPVGGQPPVVVVQLGPEVVQVGTAMALHRASPGTRRALRRASGRPGHRER
jgi:hypothetical protein